MIAVLNFAVLAMATMFAVAAAAALSWTFLRVAFVLMQPATARGVRQRTQIGTQRGTELVRGTAHLLRAFAGNR
jgi:hypothetical protein